MNKKLTKALIFISFLFLGIFIPFQINNSLSFVDNIDINQFVLIEKNSINPVVSLINNKEKNPIQRQTAILTAYSSSLNETSGDPFITASGKRVRYGIVANNCLPFGTKVKINGNQYVVLDRKNARYGCEWFDIWKPSKQEAINFGIQKNYINIISN